ARHTDPPIPARAHRPPRPTLPRFLTSRPPPPPPPFPYTTLFRSTTDGQSLARKHRDCPRKKIRAVPIVFCIDGVTVVVSSLKPNVRPGHVSHGRAALRGQPTRSGVGEPRAGRSRGSSGHPVTSRTGPTVELCSR